MNREPKSRKTGEFQSTNEAQTTQNVIRISWLDSPEKCDPGVGFSRFIGGLAWRFIIGPQPPKPGKSTSPTPVSFAFHGSEFPKNAIQASGFSRFIGGLAWRFIPETRAAEARKINEPNSREQRRRDLKLVHS